MSFFFILFFMTFFFLFFLIKRKEKISGVGILEVVKG